MLVDTGSSLEQQLQHTRRLLRKAERAQALALELTVELADVWQWELAPNGRSLGPVLGPSPLDAEVSAERLARLRHELSRLVQTLERQTALAQ